MLDDCEVKLSLDPMAAFRPGLHSSEVSRWKELLAMHPTSMQWDYESGMMEDMVIDSHYRILVLCREPERSAKGHYALGKVFAESPLGKDRSAKTARHSLNR